MAIFLRFIFGACIGSFLNVLSLRYDPDKFLLDAKLMGGRSHCPRCKKTLRWFELVPIVSFIIQRGRCRRCRARLSLQYPLVEILGGLIFVFVPAHFDYLAAWPSAFYADSIFWIFAMSALLLISAIDIRLHLIPDEGNVFLFLLGLVPFFTAVPYGSFFGSFAVLFGLSGNPLVNHIFAALIAGGFFLFLILLTRGKGMGMGDLKLAIPLGLIFGWPDILFLCASAFVSGACAGLVFILLRKKTMKQVLPFGPFLAAGAAFTFFAALPVAQWYFGLLGF